MTTGIYYDRTPWTLGQQRDLARLYNSGAPKREIYSAMQPHTEQSVAQQISRLRKEGRVVNKTQRGIFVRRKAFDAAMARRAAGGQSAPVFLDWPKAGTILFADDPRARSDKGSTERLIRPDLGFSASGSSAAWAAQG